MKMILQKINRSGIVETTWIIVMYLSFKTMSYIRTLILSLRGYSIANGVQIGKNVSIFQGKKSSIQISSGTFIGDGVRLKAGFDGSIHIANNVYIHDYSIIFAHCALYIGDNTLISPQVFITDFNHKKSALGKRELLTDSNGYTESPVTIGKNVWIGTHAVILPGVEIGDNAVVGAGSVVTKNVPANSIVAGNPAKIIKK
jgi:acetyltransferase-like isoleucine patch superfamily enzyme